MASHGIKNILASFKVVLWVIAVLWIILAVSFFFPGIKELGIRPRTLFGLVGIVCAPFLHENMGHLIANSVSLFVLGSVFLNLEKKLSFIILVHLFVIGGLGTWLIGRSGTVHIGASGVIYGIMGYLIFIGIFNRTWLSIIVSMLVLFFYSTAIWGVLPTNQIVSWESHLCGFIAGIITARAYARR